jgi:hypothetical protein
MYPIWMNIYPANSSEHATGRSTDEALEISTLSTAKVDQGQVASPLQGMPHKRAVQNSQNVCLSLEEFK